MLEKMKRTLEGVFSAGQGLSAIERHAPRISITPEPDNGPSPEIVDHLREQGVPTTFFLHGARTEPHSSPAEPLTSDGQATYSGGYDAIGMDRIPPEPFFARPDRTDDLVTRLQPEPTPFFVRLPYGNGHHMLRVHRLLRDRLSDWLLVHWAGSADDPALADECEVEQDIVARCREAAARAFSGSSVTGTVILMHGGPAGMHMALTAQVAPLLLREVLSGARHPRWMVIGIGAPVSP
jgi:peptidoglycan/xylan/chitin deacetylase (PgdA/CDA1 family)